MSSDIIRDVSSKEKESDELSYTVRSLVMVREPIASARGSRNKEISKWLKRLIFININV